MPKRQFSSYAAKGMIPDPFFGYFRVGIVCCDAGLLMAAGANFPPLKPIFREVPLPLGEGAAKRRVRAKDGPSSGPSGHLLPVGEGLAQREE